MIATLPSLSLLSAQLDGELRDNILPFWMQACDYSQGGFLGRIDGHGQVHQQAPKGSVLNARLLWTFSSACIYSHHQGERMSYRHVADRAYDYLCAHFLDPEQGGVYWMLDFSGRPFDTRKQVYAQAFALYAFSAYAQASGSAQALQQAIDLYALIERHSRDSLHGGYFEAFGRSWEPIADLRLSDKDQNEAKTMNTHLHVLEAYTALYRLWPDKGLGESLSSLLRLLCDRFVDGATGHLHLFFTEDWQLRSDVVSHGHDIEAAWLMHEAAKALGCPELLELTAALALQIADRTLQTGICADGALRYETFGDGHRDEERHWWVQAEGMVGFYQAWQLSPRPEYLQAIFGLWDYIKQHLIDKQGGEWFWSADEWGTPNREQDKLGPWKCPYHNARACMELVGRIAQRKN